MKQGHLRWTEKTKELFTRLKQSLRDGNLGKFLVQLTPFELDYAVEAVILGLYEDVTNLGEIDETKWDFLITVTKYAYDSWGSNVTRHRTIIHGTGHNSAFLSSASSSLNHCVTKIGSASAHQSRYKYFVNRLEKTQSDKDRCFLIKYLVLENYNLQETLTNLLSTD